ncbi:DUF3006 domain-containing protein [Robertmurraya kyonggiensis]|uniref:DUF3006 domain-containing protein n=1 Tax=Robertmurraya kyonggiensis TaxID=1037680 RepID=A0A4U1DA47_9BACI|nr:DUF3006 domain-containing protein [Robertmurraya kyonggiensis]TKC19445.1 DUF3006 domain-containing protein [Robertmurraya kyonggiensis]
MKAYFDRIEDDVAVLLIEETKKQFTKPIEQLPAGAVPGAWFEATVIHNEIVEIKLDPSTTYSKKQTTEDLLAKLRGKNKGSKFNRD